MKEPLDFTAAGRRRDAPPPPPMPTPSSTPPTKARSRPGAKMIVVAAVLLVAIVAGFIVARRRGKQTLPRTPVAFVTDQRFCQLWDLFTQFTVAAGVVPGALVTGTVHTDQLKQGMARFEPSISEFEQVAPSGVRTDLVLVVASVQRAATGDLAAVRSTQFRDAGQNLVRADAALITGKSAPCLQFNGSELSR